MKALFANCKELISLDLSNYNTLKITSMEGMLFYCQNLQYLNITNFLLKIIVILNIF